MLSVLKNQCKVSEVWDKTSLSPKPPFITCTAIWDTGAYRSVITQEVVDACGLIPTGIEPIRGVSGIVDAETYLIAIELENQVYYPNMRVTKGQFEDGPAVLIGMDIINTGDFTVTNFKGTTKFSFRMPSQKHIDFVQESRIPKFQHGGKKKRR